MHEPDDTIELAAPPECPTWCATSDRSWQTDAGEPSQRCHCNIPAGEDVDGEPVTVHLTRFAFIELDGVRVYDPQIEVDCPNRLDAANAVALSAVLAEAARMARTA